MNAIIDRMNDYYFWIAIISALSLIVLMKISRTLSVITDQLIEVQLKQNDLRTELVNIQNDISTTNEELNDIKNIVSPHVWEDDNI